MMWVSSAVYASQIEVSYKEGTVSKISSLITRARKERLFYLPSIKRESMPLPRLMPTEQDGKVKGECGYRYSC